MVLQINPTRCTILFNICIYFSSIHVSGIHVPTIRRKFLYLCDTVICHSVWVASGLLVGFSIQPADQTPPTQSDKNQCRIDTKIFSWWCPKHVEKRNKYIYSTELCTLLNLFARFHSDGRSTEYKDMHSFCVSFNFRVQNVKFNLLEPELFFLILAHSVYRMRITQEPNKLELWNKLHFKEKKKRRIYTMFKIFGTYICWINI